jgi:transposase-like protein
MSDERIPARIVARMIGVKTATLQKWRRFGKGPRGWIAVSPTLITYPAEEVARFIAARRSALSATLPEVVDESALPRL